MAKFSAKDKLAAVRYLQGNDSYRTIGASIGAASSLVITWVKKDKAQVVFELRTDFPLNALLGLAEIPRSTYYFLVKTFDRPDKDAELKTLIQAIYHEHKGRYGYRRITAELKNQGHKVNHKKSSDLCKS